MEGSGKWTWGRTCLRVGAESKVSRIFRVREEGQGGESLLVWQPRNQALGTVKSPTSSQQNSSSLNYFMLK